MLLQIMCVRNNEKQNYDCVQVVIFFLRSMEVAGERLASRLDTVSGGRDLVGQ